MGHVLVGGSVRRSTWAARYNLGTMVLCYSILCALFPKCNMEFWRGPISVYVCV